MGHIIVFNEVDQYDCYPANNRLAKWLLVYYIVFEVKLIVERILSLFLNRLFVSFKDVILKESKDVTQ